MRQQTFTKPTLYAIRFGDGSHYQAYSSLYEAGYLFGNLLYSLFSQKGLSNEEEVYETVRENTYRTELGFHAPFFTGYNYVSLYSYEPLTYDYYDEDLSPCQLYERTADGYEDPRELSNEEWNTFMEGVRDGILYG